MNKQVTHVIHVKIFLSKLQEEIKKHWLVLQRKQNEIIISRDLNRIGTLVGIANINVPFEKNEKFETVETVMVDGVFLRYSYHLQWELTVKDNLFNP